MGCYDPDASVAFVHIPKAAGWSVKRYLADHLDNLQVPNTPEYRDWPAERNESIPKGHLALRDWKAQTGTDPRDFDLILAVRRDPYSRELSQYLYWRQLWNEGGRMVQHALSVTHPTFTRWLRDPRSQYHVAYDYHDHRPPPYIGGRYTEYGGFYRYWLELDGEIPDNVRVIDMRELDTALPEALEPYAESSGEVPHLNEGGPDYRLSEHYTEEAARIVESRYEFAFERWYETREPWREAAA